jgi:flagellin
MALSIATNTGALMAAASATSVNKDMETSMERLSTGKRINSASDDAAGVAIASRLSSEIRGTGQAIRNAQDGQALIDTAEGAHKEVENILQRMRELAVQSSNDTNDTSDRANLQSEFSALKTEIDRIAGATTWAGQDIMTGKGGTAGLGTFNLQVGGNTGRGDTIVVNIEGMAAADLGLSLQTAVATVPATSTVTEAAGTIVPGAIFHMVMDDGKGNILDLKAVAAGGANSGQAALLAAFSALSPEDQKGFTYTTNAATVGTATRADGKSFTTTIGSTATAPAVTIAVTAAGVEGRTASTASGVSTRDLALVAIAQIDKAISTVNTQRAGLGAVSNRLDNTVNNLTSISIQLEGGRGRIEDADFAAESTSLAKSQILQQASTAMLAQANASKQNVLSLLQG